MTVLAFTPRKTQQSEAERLAVRSSEGFVSIVYSFEFEKHKRAALAAELGASVKFLASDEELSR